ncbi:hypothetical protein QYM36_007401, partial [Artemia franciscana]
NETIKRKPGVHMCDNNKKFGCTCFAPFAPVLSLMEIPKIVSFKMTNHNLMLASTVSQDLIVNFVELGSMKAETLMKCIQDKIKI